MLRVLLSFLQLYHYVLSLQFATSGPDSHDYLPLQRSASSVPTKLLCGKDLQGYFSELPEPCCSTFLQWLSLSSRLDPLDSTIVCFLALLNNHLCATDLLFFLALIGELECSPQPESSDTSLPSLSQVVHSFM